MLNKMNTNLLVYQDEEGPLRAWESSTWKGGSKLVKRFDLFVA